MAKAQVSKTARRRMALDAQAGALVPSVEPARPGKAQRESDRQFDLFVPLMRDMSLRDQRETMERPFFSLQKRKRLKPIEYRSSDGEVWVKVEAIPAYGMATIWDADIIIWAASVINQLKSQGQNDLPRQLKTTVYDLLRAVHRDTGGKGYQELRAALDRLSTTTIFTSIRAKRGRDSRFSWLDSWSVEIDPVSDKPNGIVITLSDWVYDGIIADKSLLSMHADYFEISGGLDRALYRIARKHAGDQADGWTCRASILHEKSGSDSAPKEFNRMLRRIVDENALPEYDVSWVRAGDGSAAVHFVRRSAVERTRLRAELAAEEQRLARRREEDERMRAVDERMSQLRASK